MNDTDKINDRLSEMRRVRMEKEEEARNRPRKTIAEMMAEYPPKPEAETVAPKPVTTVTAESTKSKHKKSSKFRGVSFNKDQGRWTYNIQIQGKRYNAYCQTEEGAAKEYDRIAVLYLGKDAKTNFPISNYPLPEDPVDRHYEDVDVVISTACIRSAMIAFLKAKGLKYRSGKANWVIFADLFYFGVASQDIIEISEKMGIDKNIRY